ncbi:hypothetical protein F5887DRAFT_1076387 [Amanita rubescens]|nr:hypothetical protein F5887DRAFT_1076387 [Amanita rubescens]
MSNLLLDVICKSCIDIYRLQNSIPFDVLQAVPQLANLLTRRDLVQNPGVNSQGQPTAGSAKALSVISSAATHRGQASGSRLQGHRMPGIALMQPPSLHPNLNKARALIAERKTKKYDANLLEAKAGPKISISLWASLGESRNFRMESISQSRISRVFPFSSPLRAAFDDLLLDARAELQRLYPQAQEINWGNTVIFAHESGTKFSLIQTNHRGDGPIQDLHDEFLKNRRGPRTALAGLLLEIRSVFPKTLLSFEPDEVDVVENSA